MPAPRLARARFAGATPLRRGEGVGVSLRFELERAVGLENRIDDYADLGPELSVPTVFGLGKVLRILRAARVAVPEPLALVGCESDAAALLARAEGTPLRLGLRPRFRLRFLAWTETGVERVDDVAEVREYADAYLVVRRGGRPALRLPRASVVRQRAERDRWHEVTQIERA